MGKNTSQVSGCEGQLPPYSGSIAVRFFRPNVGTGFIRVDKKSTGWFWTRKHGNGTESSSPKAFSHCSSAVSAAGGDTESEFFPKDDDAAHRLLDDITKANAEPKSARPSDLVYRLRRLELNDLGAEVRLLRDLWILTDDTTRDKLSPRSRSRIEMLVDRDAIIRALESLEINEDYNNTRASRTTYFVLSGGQWCPVASGEERTVGCVRWLNAAINHPDGSCSSVSARWPEWAHATADGTPNINF